MWRCNLSLAVNERVFNDTYLLENQQNFNYHLMSEYTAARWDMWSCKCRGGRGVNNEQSLNWWVDTQRRNQPFRVCFRLLWRQHHVDCRHILSDASAAEIRDVSLSSLIRGGRCWKCSIAWQDFYLSMNVGQQILPSLLLATPYLKGPFSPKPHANVIN